MRGADQYLFPVALVMVLGTLFLWVRTAIQNHRLLSEFKRRMPRQAYEVLPEAFVAGRNPRKFWFFLSDDAKRCLSADRRLATMRLTFIRSLTISVLAPVVVVLVMAILIFGFSQLAN